MPIPVKDEKVRRSNGNSPYIREVLYVRPDGEAAAVYLNEEFEMTEIVWKVRTTKKDSIGKAFWQVATRR